MNKHKKVEYTELNKCASMLSSLHDMERVFMGRGNPEQWTAEVLEAINKCFKTYFMSGNEPIAEIFFPYNSKGITLFNKYCNTVDGVIQVHKGKILPYAQEYFTYFTIWEKQDYVFQLPRH